MKTFVITVAAITWSFSSVFGQEGKSVFLKEKQVTTEMQSKDLRISSVVMMPQMKKDTLSDPDYMEVIVLFKVSKPELATKAMLCFETEDETCNVGVFTAIFKAEKGKIYIESNNVKREVGRTDAGMVIRVRQTDFLKGKASLYVVDSNGKLSNTFKYKFGARTN